MTFTKKVGQIPLYYSHNNAGRPANRSETLLNNIPIEAGQTSLGCTSFYLDAGFDPLYPFGYGLSYTTFEYGSPTLSNTEFKEDDVITVKFELHNTGKSDSTELVQLYVHNKV